MTRTQAQAQALLSYITREDGTTLRPISLGTLTVLQLLGNPLAEWLDTEHKSPEAAEAALQALARDRQTLAEVWYIHAAPLDQFLPALVDGDLAVIRVAALEWAMDKPTTEPVQVLRSLLTEHERVLRTMWAVVDKGGRAKNEQSPH